MSRYHKDKFFSMYMQIAETAAEQSVARRRKVGSCIVTDKGLIAIGFNGMPPGEDNCCEYECTKTDHTYLPNLETKPEVVHAEMNALNKLTSQDISAKDSILFVTTAPCRNCAEELVLAGIKAVYYRDSQSNSDGPCHLNKYSIPTLKY